MAYWASVLAALGWMYAAMASLWPVLFHRDAIQSCRRDAMGYRLDLWKVYWRLPTRAAILVVLLSAVPILAVILLDGWPVTVVLVAGTGITLALWMVAPPGMIIGFTVVDPDNSHPVLEPHSHRDTSRSLLVLAVSGFIPALGMGAVLGWMLTRLAV